MVPEVYRSLRRFGGEPVRWVIPGVDQEPYGSEEISIIEQVFNLYGDYTGTQLSAMTHALGTPWDQVWRQYGNIYGNAVIPDPIIQDYYTQQEVRNRGW